MEAAPFPESSDTQREHDADLRQSDRAEPADSDLPPHRFSSEAAALEEELRLKRYLRDGDRGLERTAAELMHPPEFRNFIDPQTKRKFRIALNADNKVESIRFNDPVETLTGAGTVLQYERYVHTTIVSEHGKQSVWYRQDELVVLAQPGTVSESVTYKELARRELVDHQQLDQLTTMLERSQRLG